MIRSFKKMILVAVSLLVLPAWLYASGNCPTLFLNEGRLITRVQRVCPDMARHTFQISHRAFEKMRSHGIKIPQTYNERMVKIQVVRKEVMKICDGIIAEN